MPRSDASRRSSALSNGLVVIGHTRDVRLVLEVMRRWRRTRLPLEAGRAPRIGAGALAEEEGPAQIAERQQVAHRQHGGAGGGEEVQQRELRRILVIAPRHAEPAAQILRKEREGEAEEK